MPKRSVAFWRAIGPLMVIPLGPHLENHAHGMGVALAMRVLRRAYMALRTLGVKCAGTKSMKQDCNITLPLSSRLSYLAMPV